MVDLSTLSMCFTGSTITTAGIAAFPRNIENIIERLEVECNGQIIAEGLAGYNHLYTWNSIVDTTFGQDVCNRRKILQNGANSTIPGANTTGLQFVIQNWLGFLGSVSPNVIDTSLIGNVRLRITLTTSQILVGNAAMT
jgi:hypothetical protein